VPDVVFSLTGAAYGDAQQHPTPEDAKFPIQTSLYGMSKAAAEGILSAFASNGMFRATAFRFVSVLGTRYMHGHVIDFVRQLVEHPSHLIVLGNGTQRKSYMHVDDCVRALMDVCASDAFDVFNLGVDDYCTVRDSVGWIVGRMGLTPEIHYGTEDRGWVGDNPFTWLDVSKAREHGWVADWGIRASVEATVDWLLDNQWALTVADRRR
jgi:UDP-glucose 4-epimerase